MVNNQLKIIKKRGHWLGEKAHLKKKTGLKRVLPDHGSTGFLLILVFCLTQTSPAIELTGSQVDPPDRSEFNNYGFERSEQD
jgi:hypothetical protein